MPEYLAPGVYVEEVSSGPPPIAGVGTTTTGMVGLTRRGPTQGRPTLVTNYGDFVRAFGGPFEFGSTFAGLQDLPYAAKGFFANGGRRLYVSRISPATAAPSTLALRGGNVTRLRRTALPGDTVLALATTRGLRIGGVVRLRQIKDGITTTSVDLTITAWNRADDEITVTAAGPPPIIPTAFESAYTTVLTDVGTVPAAGGPPNALANPGTAKPVSFGLIARNDGTWGQDLQVAVAYRSAGRAVVNHAAIAGGDTVVPVNSTAGFYVGAWVDVSFGPAAAQRVYRQVTAITGGSLVLAGGNIAAGAWNPVGGFTETRISTCEFDLILTYTDPVERTTVTERFPGLTIASIPGRHYVTQLAASALVDVDTAVGAPADNPFAFPAPADGLADRLTGGSDGTAAPTDQEYRGSDLVPNAKTGLRALEEIDEVALLAAPGVSRVDVQAAMIEQATALMDRFAVLDPPPGTSGAPATLDQLQTHANNFDTRYAAIYYPRVVVSDPLTGGSRAVAPSGHILGVYARVDNTRGVHKAPANEVILGITDLETFVSRGQQEILNPRGINVLRDLRADRRGLRVFGARCLTSEQDWVYINVRRLFIFVEESLAEGTQWAVFEPNDQRLWERVRTSISIFLEGVWRDGALMGAKKEEAFFVTADRSTMTDDDILNGRLVVEIGIAPVRPAEFVILRIGQWLGGSAVQEL
ncbi:phage tail sheath C-terminal domain-containing protein [Microbacterium sp. SSM24]|uniref:phage tail sheath C-terminal domain-containing protein n=1 Tax=Microbacterium sp. SSM24 TaxID=2991714 RepID=UPI0022270E13|nr:phage tail sheath C-terminal domain-containing protein [Microbacterium sp. SSM24]MCW3494208.1 phage tail sheath subtilisin-like domain-containing protein [Microbacterium sp. SSM24]